MATTSLGRLTLDLVAQIGQYVGPLNQAERRTVDSTNKMNKAFTSFKDQMNQSLNGSVFGSVIQDVTDKLGGLEKGILSATAAAAGMAVGGGLVAVAGLTTLAIQTAKTDAELAVLAKRANVSTTNFQILDYAARNLGMTQDGLAQSLADAQEKLGEFTASGGGGEAADFFEALKNNTKMTDDQIKDFAKTLQGKDGVEALQIMKNKLDDLGASSQEQRFIFESLGNDLGNLLPLFSDGGLVIDEYGKALVDAGVIKSKEAIQQSQILAAQTQAVNLQYQGAKSELVKGFMPALVNVADAMFGTSKNGLQMVSVGQGIGTVFKLVAATGIGVSAVVQGIGDGLGALAAMVVTAAKGDLKGVVAIYNESENQFNRIIEDSSQRLEKLWAKTESGKTVTGTLTNAILKLNQAQVDQTTGIKINTKEADENAKAKEKLAKETAKAVKEQENLNKMVGASALSGLRIKGGESIAGGQVRAYTAEFAKLTQDLLGNQLTRFTAFNDKFHQGKGGKHPIGQAFDFTVKDASEADKSIQRIQTMANKYGFVIKALNEYADPSGHATGGHIHVSVLGYKGSADALKEANAELGIISKANEDAIKIRMEAKQKQLNVMSWFASAEEKMAAENEQKIKDIQLAFAGDQTALDKYLKLQEDAYKKDVDNYRNAQKEKFESYRTDLLAQMADAQDSIMLSKVASRFGKDSYQYKMAGLNVDSKNAQSDELNSYNSSVSQINTDFDSPDEVQKRYELLELAKATHLENMKALDAEYNATSKQIALEQYQQQLSMWKDILGNGQNTFAQLTNLVKDSAGEQSASYRTMFALQQAFAVGSSLVAAWTAYTQAFADPSKMTIEQKFAGGMAVMAALTPALATIASASLTGMAHDGIDYVPKEGTWLLDKGERVLSPRQNADFTRAMNDRQSNAKKAEAVQQPQVNVRVMNSWDESEFFDAMATPTGEKIVMNIIKRNRTKLRI